MSAKRDRNVRVIGAGSSKLDEAIAADVTGAMFSFERICLPRYGLQLTLNVVLMTYLNLGVKHQASTEDLRQALEGVLDDLDEAVTKARLLYAVPANQRARSS